MKCPKCGYLGFETRERCRNCGYDFSLAVTIGQPADELPLRSTEGAGAPLEDFDLTERDRKYLEGDDAALDLDRVIGGQSEAGAPGAQGAHGALGATGATSAAGAQGAQGAARRRPPAPAAPGAPAAPSAPSAPGAPGPSPELPLFGDDDTPLITSPRPVRPPLSVRRTTPEIPRMRPRPAQPPLKRDDGEPVFRLERGRRDPEASPATPKTDASAAPASAVARLGAAIIDVMLLGVINAAVVYLTLALAGLTWEQSAALPLAPLVGFFVILDGGYLIVFTAAVGQTIGKMVTGVRVLGDDGRRVDIATAVLRTAGCGISLVTLGLGYLPAFFSADRRALQDRVAGTRVVRAR